jgi:hypothetical protein
MRARLPERIVSGGQTGVDRAALDSVAPGLHEQARELLAAVLAESSDRRSAAP